METLGTLLRRHSSAIARAAADQLDMDEVAGPLQDVIDQIAESEAPGPDAVTRFGGQPGLTPHAIARLIRAAESHSIAMLSRELPNKNLADHIQTLRSKVRGMLPKTTRDAADVAFFQSLFDSPDNSLPPAHRRLFGIFHHVLATLRDIVYVHDVQGNLLYLNQIGLDLTGFTRDDLDHGMTIFDLVVPDHVEVVKMRLESPGVPPRAPYTIEVFGCAGNRIPVEVTSRPLIESGGELLVVGIGRPMVLERQLEAEIHRSYEYIERVIHNAPIGIITTDASGIIIDANPAAVSLFGAQEKAELAGHAIYSLREREDPSAQARFHDWVAKARNVHSRYFGRTKFGVTVNCDVILVPLKGRNGDIESILMLMVDLSEQVILEHTLHQRERLSALGTIVAGVAHELNNPLTAIVGFAQILLTQNLPETVKSRVNRIAEEASRCEHIVENLMGFSRQVGTDKEEKNVNDLIMQTLALREYQLRVDGVETSIHLSPNVPPSLVAPHALQSVFLNIVNNAQQAMNTVEGKEKKLTITSDVEDGRIYIRFADTGPGISEEHITRIFDPFFTTKQPGEGTGLGLSVAYGIVRDHGGDLYAESTVGHGATFTIVLPITTEKQADSTE